jgi:hypothetical protein
MEILFQQLHLLFVVLFPPGLLSRLCADRASGMDSEADYRAGAGQRAEAAH